MASKEREEAIDKLLEDAKGTQVGPADQATQLSRPTWKV